MPTYAASACGSWDVYTSACRCAGVEPTTITVPGGAAPTVTVTVSASVVGSTLSQCETRTAFLTATTEVTLTETVTETPTPATATATDTATSTTVALETAAPTTVVVPRQCEMPGRAFRALNAFPTGPVRMMNAAGQRLVAWQYNDPSAAETSTWLLDSRGQLRLASGSLVPYIDASTVASASAMVLVATPAQVDSLVAAGTAARVQGCIDPSTGVLSLRDVLYSRPNMFSCGKALYLSSGDGSDAGSNYVALSPTTR